MKWKCAPQAGNISVEARPIQPRSMSVSTRAAITRAARNKRAPRNWRGCDGAGSRGAAGEPASLPCFGTVRFSAVWSAQPLPESLRFPFLTVPGSDRSARREIFYYDETDLMAIRVDAWKLDIGVKHHGDWFD